MFKFKYPLPNIKEAINLIHTLVSFKIKIDKLLFLLYFFFLYGKKVIWEINQIEKEIENWLKNMKE